MFICRSGPHMNALRTLNLGHVATGISFAGKLQGRWNEKSTGGGARNYEILSATMVDWRRKFFISNRLKGLEKLNIYWRRVMLISTTNRCLLRNYLESVLRVSKCLRSLEFVSFGFNLKRFSLQKLMFQLI